MPCRLFLLLLLTQFSSVDPLRCHTCVFPSISPEDCLMFPQECPAGQRCLSSMAVGIRGDLRVVLYEKSCAINSLCGLSGEKFAAGLNFTFSSECCDVDLCNGAIGTAAPCWTGPAASLLVLIPLALLLG